MADNLRDSTERLPLLVNDIPPPISNFPASSATGSTTQRDWFGKDIVQFSCPIYYVEEQEGCLTIDIMRMGNLAGDIRLNFATEDGSGKAGARYVAKSGELTIKDGESGVSIQIDVIETDIWATTLEFKVNLSLVDACCELGLYLKTCRVKVIDNQPFPSSKYEEVSHGEDAISSISGPGLLMEYAKLNFDAPGLKWRTIVVAVFDQLQNIYLCLMLWLNIYTVDTLFNTKDDSSEDRLLLPSREMTAFCVGLLYIAPMAVLHAWSLVKIKVDLHGRSILFLRSNLYRKYLNYDEHSRESVPPSIMTAALESDTRALAEGYISLLNLVRLSGKLLVLTGFTLWQNPSVYWAVIIMPICMGAFASCRVDVLTEPEDTLGSMQLALAKLVTETCEKYELVADYFQRPQMNQQFVSIAEAVRKSHLPCYTASTNNVYFPRWLGAIFVAVYITFGAPVVLSGATSLGTFLATISILGQVASDFGEYYEEAMAALSAASPLKGLTHLFMLRTNVQDGKSTNRSRREATKVARSIALEKRAALGIANPPPAGDLVPMELQNVSFGYVEGQPLFSNVCLSVLQGSLVAVAGAHRSGRSSFLKLLAHKIFAPSGVIFVPTHLRILYCSVTPVLMSQSIWKNLIFGDATADPARVRNIVEDMDMAAVLEFLDKDLKKLDKEKRAAQGLQLDEKESDEPDLSWQKCLTATEKAKLHICRAFVMNPEVLVLDKPLQAFGEAEGSKMLEKIIENVTKRGLDLPDASIGRRRPRTVFFTTGNRLQENTADIIWEIDSTKKSISSRPPDASQRLAFARGSSKDKPALKESVPRSESRHMEFLGPLSPTSIKSWRVCYE